MPFSSNHPLMPVIPPHDLSPITRCNMLTPKLLVRPRPSRPRRERCVLPDDTVVDDSSQHNLVRPVGGGRVLPRDADHDEARVRREEEFVLDTVVGVVRVEGTAAIGKKGGSDGGGLNGRLELCRVSG